MEQARAKCAQLKSLRALATTNESIDAFFGAELKVGLSYVWRGLPGIGEGEGEGT